MKKINFESSRILLLLIVHFCQFSGTGSAALAQENPYQEGLEKIELSKEQQEQLAEYSASSSALLTKALKASGEQSLHQAYDTLLNTAILVVKESHKDKLREELLMRVILNQALKLVYGLPAADGSTVLEPAVLSDKQSPEVYLHIIEDSVQLALVFAKKDSSAIQSKKLAQLPFAELADQRAYLAKQWASMTLGWKDQEALYAEALNHWLNLVRRPDNLDLAKYGSRLEEAAALQRKLTKLALPEKVRSYRAFFHSFADSGFSPIFVLNDGVSYTFHCRETYVANAQFFKDPFLKLGSESGAYATVKFLGRLVQNKDQEIFAYVKIISADYYLRHSNGKDMYLKLTDDENKCLKRF